MGDLRSINNTFLEMHQVKMPHLVSGATITKIEKQADGTLLVSYDDEVPHWAVPGTMHGVAQYDSVIRTTGWKYVDASIFGPEVRPEVCARSKYPVLSATWESNVPDLFFIGAAMANNDRKATPGFIHGFRYNIRTLFHLISKRYQGVLLPSRTFPVTTEAELETLVDAVITRVSTTSALFQMFGVLGEALVFNDGKVEWLPELPMKYALSNPEFTKGKDLITITLELGFDKFPKGVDALSFIHPNDPGGDGLCTAFVHPVFRRYSEGRVVSELHLTTGPFVRYDAPNEQFAAEFNKQKPHNQIYNMFNELVHVSAEPLPIQTFDPADKKWFTPWPSDRASDAPGLPRCSVTHEAERLPDMAMYR